MRRRSSSPSNPNVPAGFPENLQSPVIELDPGWDRANLRYQAWESFAFAAYAR